MEAQNEHLRQLEETAWRNDPIQILESEREKNTYRQKVKALSMAEVDNDDPNWKKSIRKTVR